MQLLERGQVKLDEPASTYLPDLARVQVLEAFDAKTRKATLRPLKNPITVRHLLTHTSGFGYEFFNPLLRDYVATGVVPSMLTGTLDALKEPLLYDPGTRWEYGISTDWLGRLVEAVSGQSLGDYCRRHIFAPLGMTDTFFDFPTGIQSRLVTSHQRQQDGRLVEAPPEPVKPRPFQSGGGGLYSTTADYLKFARMLLERGQLGATRVLRPETVSLMGQNQIGALMVGPLPSLGPQFAKDRVPIPGSLDKFGLGFAINTKAVERGRAAGSSAWAGIFNTFFWIDPAQATCAVLMMQMLPFLDDAPRVTLEQFERAVYDSLASSGRR
jgi:CubicO group peptidase (beta-lactamase class C family)